MKTPKNTIYNRKEVENAMYLYTRFIAFKYSTKNILKEPKITKHMNISFLTGFLLFWCYILLVSISKQNIVDLFNLFHYVSYFINEPFSGTLIKNTNDYQNTEVVTLSYMLVSTKKDIIRNKNNTEVDPKINYSKNSKSQKLTKKIAHPQTKEAKAKTAGNKLLIIKHETCS